MSERYDFKKAKYALQQVGVRSVLAKLGAHIHRPGKSHSFIRTPRHPDADTFWINMADGSWRHEGKDMGPGDILDLVAYIRDETPLKAVEWAYTFMGWQDGVAGRARGLSDAELLKLEEAARAKLEAEQARRIERGQGFARHWIYDLKPADGTIVETYLREARRMPLDLLGPVPPVLRFSEREEHIDPLTGECTDWPAMVGLLAADGAGTGIHVTYLKPDGSGKAPVEPAKMMFGIKKGSALRLTRGKGGLRPAEAVKRGHKIPLIIGEGVETTYSFALFAPDLRAWAAGDLGNMRSFPMPGCASDIILLKDNPDNDVAARDFDRVEAHWREQTEMHGARLIIANSHKGSDFNDELLR